MNRKQRLPSLHRHHTWNLAVVALDGRDHYLDKWFADQPKPSEEIRDAYDRRMMIGERKVGSIQAQDKPRWQQQTLLQESLDEKIL